MVGLQADFAAGSQVYGLVDRGCPALEQESANDRALHRPTHTFPVDRRPGMQ